MAPTWDVPVLFDIVQGTRHWLIFLTYPLLDIFELPKVYMEEDNHKSIFFLIVNSLRYGQKNGMFQTLISIRGSILLSQDCILGCSTQ